MFQDSSLCLVIVEKSENLSINLPTYCHWLLCIIRIMVRIIITMAMILMEIMTMTTVMATIETKGVIAGNFDNDDDSDDNDDNGDFTDKYRDDQYNGAEENDYEY